LCNLPWLTLSADEEQAFESMFAIGDGVDSGRIPREKGLYEIRKRYKYDLPSDHQY
jgi:hypothetical protein